MSKQIKTAFQKTILIMLVLFLFKDAAGQSRYGIMAGTGKTSLFRFNYTVEDYNKYSSVTSFWGGLTTEFPLNTHGISLFSNAVYIKKGYEYSLQNPTGTTNTVKDSGYTQSLNYIDINLTLRKKFFMGETSGFFVGTGPLANIFVSGSEKTSLNYFGNSLPSVNNKQTNLAVGSTPGAYKRVSVSWGVSMGFELNKFNIWINYNFPLTSYYQDANKAVQHKLKTYGINASYTLFTHNKSDREKREKKVKKQRPPLPDVAAKDTLADSDGDGIPDKDDKCPGHKGVAKYGGCPVPDTDGDGINDDEDKCPLVAGIASNNGCPEFSDSIRTAEKDTAHFIIYFEPAKSVLHTEGYSTLSEVIKMLKANRNMVAIFKGHTDNVGSVEANSIRSFERAMVCADYVASFYIDRKRLIVSAYGNKMPAADLNDPLVQWKNRRVEILVYEKK